MASPYIEADHVQAQQAQPEVPANAATDKLDKKYNQRVAKAITGSTSFTKAEVQENHLVELTGTPGSAFNVDMPVGITQIVLEVLNSTDAAATIRNSAGGGTGQPAIAVGELKRFRYDGTNFIALGGAAAVEVKDSGTQVVAEAAALNFTGAGVVVTDGGGGQADIDIPGGSGSGITVSNGGWELLQVASVSGVSQVDLEAFAGRAADFHSIVVVGNNITVATDDVNMFYRFKLNGTYQAGATYRNSRTMMFQGTNSALGAGNNNEGRMVSSGGGGGIGNAAGEAVGFELWLVNPFSTSDEKKSRFQVGYLDATATHRDVFGVGSTTYDGTDSTAAMEGLRIFPSSGNFSGDFFVYGVPKAKNIGLDNLQQPLNHVGAMLDLTADETITGDGVGVWTGTVIDWDAAIFDDGWADTVNNITYPGFWLGPTIAFDAAADVDPNTDQITETAHGRETGMGPFTLADNGNTPPTGLTNGTNYWIIKVDDDNFQVATSYANAIAGTQVDITADGTGTINLNGMSRFFVPAGISRIDLDASVGWSTAGAAGDRYHVELSKNGSAIDVAWDGYSGNGVTSDDTDHITTVSAVSKAIPVVAGDWFEVRAAKSGANENAIAGKTFFRLTVAKGDGFGILPKFHVSHQEAAATSGGTATSGSFQTRTVNTIDRNTIPGAGLSSNVITLPAGRYEVRAHAAGYKVDSFVTKLRQTSATAQDLLIGTAERSAAADDVQAKSFIEGEFVITEEETLEIQMRVGTTRATDGWGLAANLGVAERFLEAVFTKIG